MRSPLLVLLGIACSFVLSTQLAARKYKGDKCQRTPWKETAWRNPVVRCENEPKQQPDRRSSDQIQNLVGYWPLISDFADHSGHGQHLTNHEGRVALVAGNVSDPFGDGFAYFDPIEQGEANVLYVQDFDPYVDGSNTRSYTFEYWWKPEGNRRMSDCEIINSKKGKKCDFSMDQCVDSCPELCPCETEDDYLLLEDKLPSPDRSKKVAKQAAVKNSRKRETACRKQLSQINKKTGQLDKKVMKKFGCSDEVVDVLNEIAWQSTYDTCEMCLCGDVSQFQFCDQLFEPCKKADGYLEKFEFIFGEDSEYEDLMNNECFGWCPKPQYLIPVWVFENYPWVLDEQLTCEVSVDLDLKDFLYEIIKKPSSEYKVHPRCEKASFAAHWGLSYAARKELQDNEDDEEAQKHFMMTSGIGPNRPMDFHGCDAGPLGSFDGPVNSDLCMDDGEWHHIAFTYDDNHNIGSLYVDGLLASTSRVKSKQFRLPALKKKEGKSWCPAHPDRRSHLIPPAELENATCGSLLALGADIDTVIGWDDEQYDLSQMLQGGMTEVRFWNTARTQAQIVGMMDYRIDALDCEVFEAPETCNETESDRCHQSSQCEKIDGEGVCMCEMGLLGDGVGASGCKSTGWAVRVVYERLHRRHLRWLEDPVAKAAITEDLRRCVGADGVHFQRGVFPFSDVLHFPDSEPRRGRDSNALLVNFLFETEPSDEFVAGLDVADCVPWSVVSAAGARKYTWDYGVGRRSLEILPTGMQLDSVRFEPTCAETGCWVLDVTYTTGGMGPDPAAGTYTFNTFYLPNAVGDDTLSYDYAYDSNTLNTFQPRNFPCRTADYNGGTGSAGTPDQLTLCCLTANYTADPANPTDTLNGFLADYRPSDAFTDWVNTFSPDLCTNKSIPEVIDRAEYDETEDSPTQYRFITVEPATSVPHHFLDGGFRGMPASPGVTQTTVLDPFFFQYKATIKLDEAELRRRAGQLKGTVGVEHTIDTFLGFANFRATGLPVVDSFATQVNIHLEKTSFFSVSTHGVNDYTFLEYVNLRLVAIYNEDTDFSGVDEATDVTVRTNASNAANYVQITFTLGKKYGVNENAGLIPLDSVRAGNGVFFDDAALTHKCTEWDDETLLGGTTAPGRLSEFKNMLTQDCGPKASMCSSPKAIPDQFVSFNIPLGIDFFGLGSNTLDNNVFVDFVVNAVDNDARGDEKAPNDGEAPWQMKTTLTASIPVVAGGVNIFCDGITAKTDLKDVANVDIVVGSADSGAELTRLRILEDIASTQLSAEGPTEIDSDSIESGLMTLVIKGNESYFDLVGNTGVTVELEDVITIHVMEDNGSGEDTTVAGQVLTLLRAPPDDNTNTTGLITDGYNLNGAFMFTIDRESQRAHLEPRSALTDICPFNPPRPAAGSSPLETCVTRRDVRNRGYPNRNGAMSTAMELCAVAPAVTGCTDCCDRLAYTAPTPSDDESKFFGTILGKSDYAHQLAVDYAKAIDGRYNLNGRYRRAYWINPGYEWTPTQTGGSSTFSISQKLFLMALITLDEGLASADGTLGPDPTLERRRAHPSRRMLLSTEILDQQSGAAGQVGLTYQVTPQSMMATAMGVPADRVATFDVEMALTTEEACLEPHVLQSRLRDTFDDYLRGSASRFMTVQVLQMSINHGDVSCGGSRRGARALLSYSTALAAVKMLVVFQEGTQPRFNMEQFRSMAGVNDIQAASVSPKIALDETYIPTSREHAAEEGGSDSSNTALIAGICGGVGGLLLLGLAAFWFMRSKDDDDVMPASPVNMESLKTQLQSEL